MTVPSLHDLRRHLCEALIDLSPVVKYSLATSFSETPLVQPPMILPHYMIKQGGAGRDILPQSLLHRGTFERQGLYRSFSLVPGGIPTEAMGGGSYRVGESRWPLSLKYLCKLELLDMTVFSFFCAQSKLQWPECVKPGWLAAMADHEGPCLELAFSKMLMWLKVCLCGWWQQRYSQQDRWF